MGLLTQSQAADDLTDPRELVSHLTNSVEFGFVLLPSKEQMPEIYELSAQVHRTVSDLPFAGAPDPIKGIYYNVSVTMPHVSIGQYGCLRMELDRLKALVADIAERTGVITEPMKAALSVTDENVFLDAKGIREDTNPAIVELYQRLRAAYMDGVSTKRPIAQALLERLLNARNPEELRLLEICFQNWGTPEGNRIRPHFTLLYNYRAERAAAEKEVGGMQVPDSLRNITFTRLGIVEIDFWGNPVPGGLLAEFPFRS